MFREMRRNRQQLDEAQTVEILRRGTSGVLAVAGDDGYPYAVPLSYVYDSGKIYFHCAAGGHKIDAIRQCEKVSFCVIDQDVIVPERFTTHYRSVIAFGRAKILEDAEKRNALVRLADRYCPGVPGRDAEIENSFGHVCVVEIDIERMTGKVCRELV